MRRLEVVELASALLARVADGRKLPNVFLAPLQRRWEDLTSTCQVLRPIPWAGLLVEMHPDQAKETGRALWFGAFQWECLAGLGIGRRLVTGLRHAQDWPDTHLRNVLGLLCEDFGKGPRAKFPPKKVKKTSLYNSDSSTAVALSRGLTVRYDIFAK